MVHPGETAFILRFAEDIRVLAAELLAIAVTEATGVVAAFTIGSGVGEGDALRTAIRATDVRRTAGADAGIAALHLGIGADERFGGWGGTSCGLDAVVPQHASDSGCASQAQEAFEQAAPAGAGSKRLGKRIETTIVHS